MVDAHFLYILARVRLDKSKYLYQLEHLRAECNVVAVRKNVVDNEPVVHWMKVA